MGRTAPLTSKRCILYIYSTNVGTEYFKHALYSPFFSLQNGVCFIMLTCLVPVLFTFYIQDVLKFKKIIPAPRVNPARSLQAGQPSFAGWLCLFDHSIPRCLDCACLIIAFPGALHLQIKFVYKYVPAHAIKTYRESEGIAPLSLIKFSTRWR